MEYLYREYGQVKAINLNKSVAPTFGDALKKEPGVSPSEYEKGWWVSLSEKFGS